jgi:hypothetical protein
MCEATFDPIFDDRRQDLIAFGLRLRHQYNQFTLPPHFYRRMGSFAPANVAPNGGLFAQIGPWTGASANAFIDSRTLCVRNTGAAAGQARSGAITVTADLSYALRIECMRGKASTFRVMVGTAAGGSTLLDSGSIGEGVYTGRFTSTSTTTIHVTLVCNTSTTSDFVFFDQLVIERCGRIATPLYTTPRDNVVISDLPATQFGLLQKADMIEVNGELKGLLHGLNTLGDGTGYVTFNPPTRVAIPENSPVVIGSPRGRFFMREDPMRFKTQGFFSSSFSVSLIEDIST